MLVGIAKRSPSVTYDLKPGSPGAAVGTSQVADAVICRLGEP